MAKATAVPSEFLDFEMDDCATNRGEPENKVLSREWKPYHVTDITFVTHAKWLLKDIEELTGQTGRFV